MFFMRFPEGRAKALTFSYDDGVEQDETLVSILNNHGLKGTFNLNSGLYAPEGKVYEQGTIHRRMTRKQIDALFQHAPHEVACHALAHPFLEQIPQEMATYEIIKDKENLEAEFGTIIRGMAYPYGTYNDNVVAALKAAGISYARTTKETEGFAIPTDWLRLESTCHHTNPNLMELGKKFLQDTPNRAPYLFYLWGHSYEFEMHDNWKVIEDFTALMANHDSEVWYATNIAIADYVRDYHRLIASADGSLLQNPTSQTLWLAGENEVLSIRAGETITLPRRTLG